MAQTAKLMLDNEHLIEGAFYWVLPVFDPDTDQEWQNEIQPARFAGRRDDGTLLWHCLDLEAEGPSNWPMRWIGDRIMSP